MVFVIEISHQFALVRPGDALVGDTSVELIPFSDLKSRANKYLLEMWQSKWDDLPGNELHEIFPVLKQCVVCPRTNRKEETYSPIAHWPFFLLVIPFY